MAVYIGDRYLNSQDSDFVNLVSSDLQRFLDSVEEKTDQVLMFPPVSSYHRFLIHKTVEDFPVLCSFSVGEGDDRRSVVCLQDLVLRKVLSADTEATKQNLTKEEENQSCVHEGGSGDSTCSSSGNMSSQKPDDSEICTENVEKGPMPNLESAMTHTKDNTPDIIETLTSVSQADAGCLKSSTTIACNPDTDTNTHTHSSALCSAASAENSNVEETADQKYAKIDVDTVASASVCDSDEHKAEACSGAELEQTNSLTHSDCISSDGGRDSLHNGQPDSSVVHCDSNGEINTRSASDSCPTLSSALMNELLLAVGAVRVTHSAVDYKSYLCQEADSHSEEDYGRLIEIYDFPEEMITRDLLVLFKEFGDKHFDVKWVDKTHAIGVFSNQEIAEHAIASFDHPLVKVCPLHLASAETKQIARKSRDILEPRKPRPETTASAAINMVHGALGLRCPSSKEHTKEHKSSSKEHTKQHKSLSKEHLKEHKSSSTEHMKEHKSSSKEHTKEHKKRSNKSDDHRHSSSKSKRQVWDGKLRPCAMDME